VTLFTKHQCTLCDKVKEVLAEVREEAPHGLDQVDITDPGNEKWWDKYKYDIPVLHVQGRYWAKHRLSPEEALSAIADASEGTFEERNGEPDASRLEGK